MICIAFEDDPEREGSFKEWFEASQYGAAADALSAASAARVGGLREAAITAALKLSDMIGDGFDDLIGEYERLCTAFGVNFTADDPDADPRSLLATQPAAGSEG